jgi:hypothetical protein
MEEYFILWRVFLAIAGSFATAYVHQRTGRDVTMGGLIGAAVGGIGGIWFLLMLWIWIYYFAGSPVGRMYGVRRKVWYRWWD